MEKDLALVEQFLDALWLEKNLAENTLSAYRRDLTMLVEWLARRELSLASAQSDDLQALLAERVEGAIRPPVLHACSARCVGCSSISTVRRFGKTIRVRFWRP